MRSKANRTNSPIPTTCGSLRVVCVHLTSLIFHVYIGVHCRWKVDWWGNLDKQDHTRCSKRKVVKILWYSVRFSSEVRSSYYVFSESILISLSKTYESSHSEGWIFGYLNISLNSSQHLKIMDQEFFIYKRIFHRYL